VRVGWVRLAALVCWATKCGGCLGDVSLDADVAEFVAARWAAVLRFGELLTGSVPDAEDLVQAALARTAARWRSVRDRDRPEAYVRQAMVRLHVNRWRGLLSRERPAADLPDRAVDAEGIEAVAGQHRPRPGA
jgi:DNA-directed RNA polymerase specialized sigma24 family protein